MCIEQRSLFLSLSLDPMRIFRAHAAVFLHLYSRAREKKRTTSSARESESFIFIIHLLVILTLALSVMMLFCRYSRVYRHRYIKSSTSHGRAGGSFCFFRVTRRGGILVIFIYTRARRSHSTFGIFIRIYDE